MKIFSGTWLHCLSSLTYGSWLFIVKCNVLCCGNCIEGWDVLIHDSSVEEISLWVHLIMFSTVERCFTLCSTLGVTVKKISLLTFRLWMTSTLSWRLIFLNFDGKMKRTLSQLWFPELFCQHQIMTLGPSLGWRSRYFNRATLDLFTHQEWLQLCFLVTDSSLSRLMGVSTASLSADCSADLPRCTVSPIALYGFCRVTTSHSLV